MLPLPFQTDLGILLLSSAHYYSQPGNTNRLAFTHSYN